MPYFESVFFWDWGVDKAGVPVLVQDLLQARVEGIGVRHEEVRHPQRICLPQQS
jgi:hypothetical protein